MPVFGGEVSSSVAGWGGWGSANECCCDAGDESTVVIGLLGFIMVFASRIYSTGTSTSSRTSSESDVIVASS